MNFDSDFKSFLNKYERETILNTARSFSIIANRTIGLAAIFDSSPQLKEAKAVFSGFAAFFTVRSMLNSSEKIVKNLQKEGLNSYGKVINFLETAISGIGIQTGIISITRTIASFKLIDLEKFSSMLGYIPVAQTLSQASSILSIISTAISISIESIKIHERSQKIDNLKERALTWAQPMTLDFVQKKITKQTLKFDQLAIKIHPLTQALLDNQTERKDAQNKYKDHKTAHQETKGLEKLRSWYQLKVKKRALKKLNMKQLSLANGLNQAIDLEARSLHKLAAYTKIQDKWNHLTDEDNATLAQFQIDKTAKSEHKIEAMKFDQIKAGIGLGLTIVGLIISIASLILGMTGIGLIPVLTTMAVLGLVIALANLGFAFFKRHTSYLKPVPVPVPLLP